MNGKNKVVHFLSASDRVNYGDLLFPIIFKKILSIENSNIEFLNYGIIKSNLTSFGALKTNSYKKLIKNVQKSGGNIVIGGGEVFFADWRVLYAFINPVYVLLRKKTFFKRLDNKLNLASRFLINNRVKIPFAPSKDEFSNKNITIFYNSVGGVFTDLAKSERHKTIVQNLKEASVLSVRDQRSKDSLHRNDLSAALSPDSALIMSDVFSLEKLNNLISFDKKQVEGDFIFFQIGKNKAPSDLKKLAISLESLAHKLNLKVLLCPIGLAPNHEDDKVLSMLNEYSDVFQLFIPENLYDIMFLIAISNFYMGTSLHGLITAQSFNIPFVPMNKNVNKMSAYCKTWTHDYIKENINFSEFENVPAILNKWDDKQMSINLEAQKEMVYNNFKNIITKLL